MPPIAAPFISISGWLSQFVSFKSQALLDEQAVLACMVYVDLNPIRAGICNHLESSEFTSIQQRIAGYSQANQLKQTASKCNQRPTFQSNQPDDITKIRLATFTGSQHKIHGIPYTQEGYFELADWTGRAIRDDKRGIIPASEPKIISKLGINSGTWLETFNHFNDNFHTFIGPEEKLKQVCQRQKKRWLLGINLCRKLFHHQNPLSL